MQLACHAQSTTSTPDNAATPPSASATPPNNDAVIKELVEMKARIAQLEAELKASGASSTSATPVAPATVVPTPAASPAPPEISAERTTKEAPFPGDWTWLNSNGRVVDTPMATKYFVPEFRADINYTLDYNHPKDDTLGGSTETFRSDEFQVEQLSFGGDIRIDNVRGRFLTMYGMFATTTPRNDSSYNRGQWDLSDAYKYVSEAWGGYHWDYAHGVNVDAGIFVSYIGLFSYYNADNWTYQPSFVSSNTPWFFNGLRIQYFPTSKLKIEPWIINGWQSYARYNGKPGLGGQILWRPKPYLDFVFNNYGLGEDSAGFPGRSRIHTDDSAQVKLYDNPKKTLDKIAFTFTGDLGCEMGGGPVSFATPDGALNQKGLSPMMGTTDTYNGGVNCHNSKNGLPKQMFAGWMAYNRLLVQEGPVCNYPGRRNHEQPGPLSDSSSAHQWRNGNQRLSVLYRERGRSSEDARQHHHLRLHAEPVHHLPRGDRLPLLRHALLDWSWRHYASRRQQWLAGRITPAQAAQASGIGYIAPDGTAGLPEAEVACNGGNQATASSAQYLVARPAHQPNRQHAGSHGQILAGKQAGPHVVVVS